MGGVALLSGGLDSTVAAACATREGGLDAALFIEYGQRAARRERAAAEDVARFLGVRFEAVEVPFLRRAAGSALTDPSVPLPEPDAAELDLPGPAAAGARAVWVPNRNGLFINIAACVAEMLGAFRVIAGFNAEEGAVFPDNSAAFLEAVNASLSFSTAAGVRVESATAGLDKAGVVRLGLDVGAPLELIWSCYAEGETHCWRCASCRRLRRALDQNGVFDLFVSRGKGGA